MMCIFSRPDPKFAEPRACSLLYPNCLPAEAEASIREYIEIFYNRQRRHSRLGYLAPAVFAQKFSSQQAAA